MGLFARLFLDTLRDLCACQGKDYYDRICYVIGDYSEQMLIDIARRGVLANHPGRYLLRVINALDPYAPLAADPAFTAPHALPFRAVFLNYVLDCLPPMILQAEEHEVRQPHVRLCLSRNVDLHECTDLTREDLARLAASSSPGHRDQLLPFFGLFTAEYQYRPVEVDQLPHGEFVSRFARSQKGNVVYNWGAVESLERLLVLLWDRGFALINDYGYVSDATDHELEHQRFSNSTAIGLNFALLQAYFAESRRCVWVEPGEDSGHIYSRLLSPQPSAALVTSFKKHFTKAAGEFLDGPAQKASELAGQLRYEAATSAYRLALERQPWNWLLMLEVANFLNYAVRDPGTALKMAQAGLQQNPCCSAELWNAYGDALYSHGKRTSKPIY